MRRVGLRPLVPWLNARPMRVFRLTPIWVVALALIGGLVTLFSLVFHARIPAATRATIVSNRPTPHEVVVVVHGSPQSPGFTGFVARLDPRTTSLKITPISSSLPVSETGQTSPIPLWTAASTSAAKTITASVGQATDTHPKYYFYVSTPGLEALLTTLHDNVKAWPTSLTPQAAMRILGYPSGTPNPQQELHLFKLFESDIPLVHGTALASLLTVLKDSDTNLSGYQLFELGNYLRGGKLVVTPPLIHTKLGQTHG